MEIADGFGGKHIRFNHGGLDTPIVLGLESKGTRRLIHLLPLIKFALDVTGLAILDEIDGALHVDMLGEILSWFRSRESNLRNAQLLVSSHHVGLLDDLEKEEVFIVEKDGIAVPPEIYGAQDVKGLRRDVRLYSKYRRGRGLVDSRDSVEARCGGGVGSRPRRVVFIGVEGKSDRADAGALRREWRVVSWSTWCGARAGRPRYSPPLMVSRRLLTGDDRLKEPRAVRRPTTEAGPTVAANAPAPEEVRRKGTAIVTRDEIVARLDERHFEALQGFED